VSITFNDLRTPYDAMRQQLSRKSIGIAPDKFYDAYEGAMMGLVHKQILAGTDPHAYLEARNRAQMFRDWHKFGCPTVKVWPAMASMLADTKINIEGKHFHSPFPATCVRLPVEGNPFVENEKYPLKSFMIFDQESISLADLNLAVRGEQDPNATCPKSRMLVLYMDFGEMRWDTVPDTSFGSETRSSGNFEARSGGHTTRIWEPRYEYIVIKPEPERTLADSLDEALAAMRGPSPEGGEDYIPSPEMVRGILALAACTCFFVTNQHEVIRPDIPRKETVAYEWALKTGDRVTVAKLEQKAREDRPVAMTLGRAIDLPRPLAATQTHASGGGTHILHWSHSRSAHARWQPVGPRKDPSYELRFIAPVIVRPDLPARPHAGFNLRGAETGRTKAGVS